VKLTTLSIITFALLLLTTSYATTTPKYQTLYSEAKSLFDNRDFSNAAKTFTIAIKNNKDDKRDDSFYLLGQSLYALNELPQASKAFRKSYEKKVNEIQSLYYIGHISQLLQKYRVAIESYEKLLKKLELSDEMKQLTMYHIAEIRLAEAYQINMFDRYEFIHERVIPSFKRAAAISPDSELAMDIENQLEKLYEIKILRQTRLNNGRIISSKKYSLSLKHQMLYDNNITSSPDDATTSETKKDDLIYETTASISARAISKGKMLYGLNLQGKNTSYKNQQDPDIYSQDELSILSGVKISNEHRAFSRPATAFINGEYKYTTKDYYATHKKNHYASQQALTLGESFTKFKFGETTLSLELKKESNIETDELSSTTFEASAAQVIGFKNHSTSILYLMYENSIAKNSYYSTSMMGVLYSYTIPEVFKATYLTLTGFGAAIDTGEQKSTRGTERLASLTTSLNFLIAEYFHIGSFVALEKKSSSDINYSYDKISIGLNIELNI